MRVCVVSFARPSGFDPWPSSSAVAGCTWRLLTVSAVGFFAYVAILAVATTVGHLLAGPDPRLLRAACASKTSADAGRRVLSMTSIPRGSSIVREIAASTEAELRAWADVEAVCP